VMERLTRHSWPGNIRELQNFIERSVILTSGPVLCAPLGDLKSVESETSAVNRTLADAERAHILQVLRQVDWVVGGHRGAAVRLGLPRTTLLYRMRKLGIVPQEAPQNSC
jgi:formate hydrogenlyase transcriptional activator